MLLVLFLLITQNKKYFPFLFTQKEELKALDNHFIFFEIQSWLDYQIDYRCNNVTCPIRGEIAKKFLHIRFELKRDYYKKLIEQYKKKKHIEFQDVADSKLQLEEDFCKRAIAEGIPEIVIKKFRQHISQSEIADLYLYERILQYDNFRTDAGKLSAIFCIDLKDMYIAGKDIEEVIMGLNGEIDKALNIPKRRVTD